MLANELIDRLERLGLLDQEIIEALREQLDQGTRVTPEAVAKLLVDNGQLTRFQATKLIGELRSGEYEEEAEEQEPDEYDLTSGFDLLDGAGEPDGVLDVDSEDAVAEAVEVEPVVVEAVPVEPEITADLEAVRAVRPTARIKKPDPQKSTWDSFKIYGVAGLVVILTLAAFGLYFMLNRKSADDYIQIANKLYDQQSWTPAQEGYIDFLASFGEGSQYSSLARTRIVMTKLYRSEQNSDPTQAIEECKRELPTIENEEAMNDERGNLSALLVDIAENLATAAGEETETTKKQELLGKLDEQIELIENPMYVTSSMKTTLSAQLNAVSESRARVKRDIERNIRLDETVADMTKALDENQTKAAYDQRFELLRDFPELHSNERLETLITTASGIQQTLVVKSSNLPDTLTEADEAESLKTIVLTNRQGQEVPNLADQVIYVRARSAVLAFDGETGKLLWRKFVGFGQDHAPVQVDEGGDVLLSESAKLEVQLCSSENGNIRWRSVIGEPFTEPISVETDVYISTKSGRFANLDVDSGEAKWIVQIPQEIEVGPGIDRRANKAYLPASHSNLYVLNTRDGTCLQSYYMEHAAGTIVVPPIPMLGHVFVIENKGTDFAMFHILKVDDAGENLEVAQPPVRLVGNVTVKPIVQGRRLIVLTDRGQVSVFDIETAADQNQVSVVAELPASYSRPTSTEMAVDRSQMWISGTRIGRYELQINTGRVERDWVKHDRDTFIGSPYATPDALIYARILRGSSAIRVTAADPQTGNEIWRTDVGVPISLIVAQPDKVFHVVTSQAALYELDLDALKSGSTRGPIEDPGGSNIALNFENPLQIDASRTVLLNTATPGQAIIYEPKRTKQKLRMVTLQLGGDRPGGEGVIAGGGLFLPLTSGRATLSDCRTGKMLGSPYQPASDPTATVRWTNAVTLPSDADQVVVADNRKTIYRLRAGDQVRELAKKPLENELIGKIAVIGTTILGVTNGPAADFVVGYDAETLTEKFKTLLTARVVWGPVSIGENCWMLTDDAKMLSYTGDGQQLFSCDMPAGKPVGQPLSVGDSIVLAGSSGWIVAIHPESGELLGTTDLGQPISATPLPVGDRLLVPGREGVVYIADMPGGKE